MRWSQALIPTLKETPADAVAASHILLTRAGLIRQLGAGAYTYLPLGLRVLRKASQIIREEMDRAGAQELLMPALSPVELWKESGRHANMGGILMELKLSGDRHYVLGPTHEEVVTDIARDLINSYKQMPITLYQIQTKFRDEPRPRFGVGGVSRFDLLGLRQAISPSSTPPMTPCTRPIAEFLTAVACHTQPLKRKAARLAATALTNSWSPAPLVKTR